MLRRGRGDTLRRLWQAVLDQGPGSAGGDQLAAYLPTKREQGAGDMRQVGAAHLQFGAGGVV
jgi:hypothetical protein